MKFRAFELRFVSRPICMDIGDGTFRRITAVSNSSEQAPQLDKFTRIHVEGLKFPIAVPEMMQVEVEYI